MVKFNKVEISEDFNSIFIDVEIPESPSFSGYYIGKIYVEYYKNRKPDGEPSKKAAVFIDNSDNDVASISGTFNISTMRKADSLVSSFKNGLFYVIVECYPMHNSASNKIVDTKAVFDMHRLYSLGMVGVTQYLSNCHNGRCDIQEYLRELILLWYAIKLSDKTNDFGRLNELWDRSFSIRHTTQNCCK